MRCAGVRGRLSAWLDGELPSATVRAVRAHLATCEACGRRAAELSGVSRLLGELPRLESTESVAERVLTRLEVEQGGPGLRMLLRRYGAARPFIMPSLVPAALVLLTLLSAALALDSGARAPLPAKIATWGVVAALGTESNPLFPSAGVGLPRERDGRRLAADDLVAAAGRGSLFLETVVARDGTVFTVTVLRGNAERAGPLLVALRQQRYEPIRYRGRLVAVSVYRLISHTDVYSFTPHPGHPSTPLPIPPHGGGSGDAQSSLRDERRPRV